MITSKIKITVKTKLFPTPMGTTIDEINIVFNSKKVREHDFLLEAEKNYQKTYQKIKNCESLLEDIDSKFLKLIKTYK